MPFDNPSRPGPSESDKGLLAEEHHERLLGVAMTSIEWGVAHKVPPDVDPQNYPEPFRLPHATFVTLSIDSQLRGCMGSLEVRHPLVVDVARNAFSSAFRDPRFPGVRRDEVEQLEIHISILSESTPVDAASEDELLERIRPGIDGLVLLERGRRSTLLPAVWRHVSDPRVFVGHLKKKAGLPSSYWSDTLRFERYTAQSVGVERL